MIWPLPDMTSGKDRISGIVYHDLNHNQKHEEGEPGIPGVLVSNGRDIVMTDEKGRYDIPVDDNQIIFVIKPRNWTTYTDKNGIPRFYYIHSLKGAGGTDYPGLNPTGPLPESVDFALYPQPETERFRAVIFGDTQPRNLEQLGYLAHDSIQELIGVNAAFGVTLGDLVARGHLNLFQPLNEVIGQIGIPWRHLIGNHDIDRAEYTNWDARGAFYRTYGPSWYAFTKGNTHFLALDNIRWIVEGDERYYQVGLGDDQLEFIENFLSLVPDDDLVFLLTHIPLVDINCWEKDSERIRLFEILASHPNIATLAAHRHHHYHRFLDSNDGWPGEDPHHMVSIGAVSGSWWRGKPDEYGIPHAMMRDGTPTGYAFLEIDENNWKIRYKAARRPDNFQMHIYTQDEVTMFYTDTVKVFVNIFNALPDANVEMRIGNSNTWQNMKRTEEFDPMYESMLAREYQVKNPYWRLPPDPQPRAPFIKTQPYILWKQKLPANLEPGTYTIHIRAEDKWHSYEGRRIVRITEAP